MPQIIDKPVPKSLSLRETTELVSPSDPRAEIISVDPERLWGVPCFVGTRLPVKSLFDHLERGVSLAEFMDNFEGVPREVCIRTLQMAYDRLMDGLPQASALDEDTP